MKRTTIFTAIIIAFVLGGCDGNTDSKNEDNHSEAEASQLKEGHDHENAAEHSSTVHSENEPSKVDTITVAHSTSTASILNDYMNIEDALVKKDRDLASKAGKQLAIDANSFDVSGYTGVEQKKLNDIIEVVEENGEHIGRSELHHQREHFEMLGRDIKDLVVIAGSDRTLYQFYCPEYNDNEGGIWLSTSEEAVNPMSGSNMPECGNVQQTIVVK